MSKSVGVYFKKEREQVHYAIAVFDEDAMEPAEAVIHEVRDAGAPAKQIRDEILGQLETIRLTYGDEIEVVRHRTRTSGFAARAIIRTAAGRRPMPFGPAEVTEAVALGIENFCDEHGIPRQAIKERRGRDFFESASRLLDRRGIRVEGRFERNAVMAAAGITPGTITTIAKRWLKAVLRLELGVARRTDVARELADLDL